MDVLSIITILIIVSATFSYLNERFIKLPGTIGVMSISVLVSIIILIIGKVSNDKTGLIINLAHNINFSKVLLDVMLGFLLFATALHFNYRRLKELRKPVILLSTIGVLMSTAVFGGLLFIVCGWINVDLPFTYCLLFGALISPTDPIAVSAILKTSKIPPRLETIISGESMFNDAVGLILFVTIYGIVDENHADFSVVAISKLFAAEVIGGIAIGAVTGYLGYRLIKSITDFQTIFLLTIALVLGISVIANKIHASGPLAAVTAGLIIGNKNFGSAHPAQKFLNQVWQLVDDMLNTILFVMIGLQLVLLHFLNNYWVIGLLSIVIILVARFISISIPGLFILRKVNLGNLSILTWAGLRGGISVAMALSLPESKYREIILSACYVIVIFSVIVQGLSLNKLVERVAAKQASDL